MMGCRGGGALALLAGLLLAGCQYPGGVVTQAPSSAEVTFTYSELTGLPDPAQELVAAVYDFPDLTGQYKPSETVTTYSRAVTQGGAYILEKALRDAGRGKWFRVTERRGLDHLLKERQIIREQRSAFAGGGPVPPLPAIVFAGLLIEGGIVSFDSNTLTGGVAARYLGIGGDTQYRQDTVTVYVSVVSSQTGEVLKTVTARKTIASYALHAGTFKYVGFKDLLEAETGFTVNEPGQLALQEAVEHAVRGLVIEGAASGLWGFKEAAAGAAATRRYLEEKGELPRRRLGAAGMENVPPGQAG